MSIERVYLNVPVSVALRSEPALRCHEPRAPGGERGAKLPSPHTT